VTLPNLKPRYWFGIPLALLTLFYAATAIVWYEGELSYRLVVRQEIGFSSSYGFGEEGAWARAHPGQPLPWWQSENLIVLTQGSPEIPESDRWREPYFLGRLVLMILWIGTLIAVVVKWFRSKT
jgi:hypothetical protein